MLICWNANFIGEKLGVWAVPDSRKRHQRRTPQVGGLAILAGFGASLLILLISKQAINQTLPVIELAASAAVGLLGFLDDRADLRALARILALVLAIGIAIGFYPELVSRELNWGIGSPTPITFWTGFALLIAASVGIVNAVNMADGLDGIAGGMFIVWSACLMWVVRDHPTSFAMATAILFSSVVFFAFNIRGALFLGDCGSYGVTFALGLLVMLAHSRGELCLVSAIVWFLIPVVDCIRMMVTRIAKGRSPFLSDCGHFHHRLERRIGRQGAAVAYVVPIAAASLIATVRPSIALNCVCCLAAYYLMVMILTLTTATEKVRAVPVSENEAPTTVRKLPTSRGGASNGIMT
jgi:UDP-GlcNAc:undecaprenyl-phosphate GlcNAc-1-phosphate transferase